MLLACDQVIIIIIIIIITLSFPSCGTATTFIVRGSAPDEALQGKHTGKAYSNSCRLSIDVERMKRIDRELIGAAEENNLPEVSRLLSVGADVNVKDNFGWTPLHTASMEGHLQVVKVLQDHGADIEAEDNDEWTPLHFACANDHVTVVNELMSPTDSNGTTTSIHGKRKSRGADIEAKNRNGDTPLHMASWRGHLAVAKALLSGGADILTVNNIGCLPIHEAVRRQNSEVSKYLLQQNYATIHRLPLHGLVEDLTWIGSPYSIGAPPIREALHRNVLGTDDVVEIVEYLVGQNPALLSSRDQDGSLPLHVACRHGASFSIVQSLVNLYKASVKSVTPQGDLPLLLACELPEPSLDTIFLLIKLYPDVVYR
jgi:ankyrin repeat protein